MSLHRSRRAALATMLAFLAVLGMSVLGGWHAATFHDDPPELTVSLDHVPLQLTGATDDHDDTVVHVAAHEVGHAFGIPSYAAPAVRLAAVAPAWPTLDPIDRAGTGPSSLLRPPRA